MHLTSSKMRLLLASVTAFLVFVITYLASWVAIGNATAMDYQPIVRTEGTMHFIHSALLEFEKANGEYPESLEELAGLELEYGIFPSDDPYVLRDGWAHPLCYVKTNGEFVLNSFGRDGKPGGVGLDADIYLGKPAGSETRLPLSQFLFQTPGSGVLFRVALFASVLAGATWYVSTNLQQAQRLSGTRLLTSFTVVIASAVVIAVLLAVFYVLASQSGH